MKATEGEVLFYGLEKYDEKIDQLISLLRLDAFYFDIKIILTEGITNAFKHGNSMDAEKPIYVNYSCDEKKLNIKIKDCGCWKRVEIPDSISDDKLLDECGRGLFMLQCFADRVEFIDNSLVIDKILNKSN